MRRTIDASRGEGQSKGREGAGRPEGGGQEEAKALAFPDGSFDAAAGTFVFCSVPDPVRALRELGRVVRPGGRIYLLEHLRIESPMAGFMLDMLNPLVSRLYGVNINRRTQANMVAAGLQIESVEELGPMGMVRLIVART